MSFKKVTIVVGIETWQVVRDNLTNEGVITVTAIYRSLPRVYNAYATWVHSPFISSDNCILTGVIKSSLTMKMGDNYKDTLENVVKLGPVSETEREYSWETGGTTCRVKDESRSHKWSPFIICPFLIISIDEELENIPQ